jgi:hypothetical protein
MSETRIFRTETRPRREVSTSREIENETRREIYQWPQGSQIKEQICRGAGKREKRETCGQADRVLVSFVSYRWVAVRTSNETLSKVFSRPNLPNYLTYLTTLPKWNSTKWSFPFPLPKNPGILVSFTSRKNFLLLVSHEKLHFSRETRTRRDLAHGYQKL